MPSHRGRESERVEWWPLLLVLAAAAWALSGGGLPVPDGPVPPAPPLIGPPTPVPAQEPGVPWLLLAAVVMAAGAALLVVARVWARRLRRVVRLRLIPGRTDESTPERTEQLFETLHQLVLRRWWQRLLTGQPGLALELRVAPGPGGMEAILGLALPDDAALVAAVRGRLQAAFRDLIVERDPDRPPGPAAVVRLKKRRPFTLALLTPEREQRGAVDPVLATMTHLAGASVVQLALVPTPAAFERVARRLFESRERGGTDRGGRWRKASELLEAELEGGLRVQHRGLFFADVRVGAASLAEARVVARTVRGETAQENRLMERTMHARGRLGLYRGRIARAAPNPLPDPVRGVLSSAELAGLWQLPSPFLHGVRLARSPVPRVPAPPEIRRVADPRQALGRDPDGFVALNAADRYGNLALLGRPGGGKTSVMLRSAMADMADPNCALIILDPKGELADHALRVLPADGKPVHVVSLAQPEAGIDPFRVPDGSPHTAAAGIVSALKAITEDATGQSQVGFSSDRYLRQGAIAIAATEPQPDMWKLWRLLNASEDQYREQIAERLRGHPGLEQTQLFLGQELPYQLARSPANFITRLDAPANKAIRTTTGALDVCFRHPHSIDVDQVIADREVLIIEGSAGQVETDDVAVVMQFALGFIHQALLRQQARPKHERARVALKVDEAHLGIFSHRFAELLALGRSAGLECVCAFQSPSQIADRALRTKIFDLLQNWCVFHCGEDAARELSALLQTVYADVQRDDLSSRERQRISTDALINLPRHYFAASWLAGGARALPFVAQTLPMDDGSEHVRALHLERQRERGGRLMTAKTLPVAYETVGRRGDEQLGDDAPRVVPQPREGNRTNAGPASATPQADGPDATDEKRTPVSMRAGAPRAEAEPAPGAAATRQEGARVVASTDAERAPAGRGPARSTPGGETAAATPSAAAPDPGPTSTQSTDPEAAETTRSDSSAAGTPAPAKPTATARRRVPITPPTPEEALEQAGVKRLGTAIANADLETYVELDAYESPVGLKWETPVPVSERRKEPSARELAILAALSELKVLTTPQLQRRFMPGLKERAVRDQLGSMFAAGWVRRLRIVCEHRAQTPRIYALTLAGWELVKDARTHFRPFTVAREAWRAPDLREDRRLLHDLHANAWFFAFERATEPVVVGVRGPWSSRLFPPSIPDPAAPRDPRRRQPMPLAQLAQRALGSAQRFDGLADEHLAPIYPDLTIEVSLPDLPGSPRQNYLVEMERSRHSAGLRDKLRRYDALITAWSRTQAPYKSLGLPPAAIFVLQDEPKALAAARLADELLLGRVATLEDPAGRWPYPGRKRIFFVAERDIHQGSLRAYMVPAEPPKLRRAALGLAGKPMPFVPVQRDIIKSDVLRLHRAHG